MSRSRAGVLLCLVLSAACFAVDAKPIPDDAYVTTGPDGHLQLKGKRVRFWGFIHASLVGARGGWWEKQLAEGDTTAEGRAKKVAKRKKDLLGMADRIADLGFNLIRFVDNPTDKPYTKGDGSGNDMLAWFIVELEKRNIKLWKSHLMDGAVTTDDVNLIDDPKTAKAWKAAVKEAGGEMSFWSTARCWDRRIEAGSIRNRSRIANWKNLYKDGIRLADDPQVVIWELENEERWQQKMYRGEWMSLPQFFQDELLDQWNDFLKARYGNDKNLSEAWLALLPGESLKEKTVQLMPLLSEVSLVLPSDANPQVIKLLKKTAKQKYGREHFNRQRGADVVEFIQRLLIASKTREKEALEKEGKSTRLSPVTVGTAEGCDIHDLLKYQHSDAVAIASYMNGFHHDPNYKRFPWYSGLEEPPRTGWNVPWLETQRIPKKPYIVYECGFESPAKYRAEWPYRIVMLASIQDFDIINWHIWGSSVPDQSRDKPWDGAMATSHPEWNVGAGPLGLIYQNDEVYTAALKGAGEIFKNLHIKPVEKPTVFVFGTKNLYDPSTMDYGVAYGDFRDMVMPTMYRYGLHMYVDTNRVTDTIIGPTYKNRIFEPLPYRPTDQIELDYQKGYLKLDAPGAVSYCGFYAQYGGPVSFSNGMVLKDITINNPADIAYPVGKDELYICFSAAARDGKPLGKSRDVQITLVSTSFNKGFKLDESKIRNEFLWQANPKAVVSVGEAPVRKAQPGAILAASELDGMKYTFRDWHMEKIGGGKVKGGKLVIPDQKPIFVIELKR